MPRAGAPAAACGPAGGGRGAALTWRLCPRSPALSRSARLFTLVQALRRRRLPVTAAALAAETGVSVRTVYRDIETLVGQGAPIAGEAGLGYVLGPGFVLPPLMFDDDEVDALILGLRLVERRGDPELQRAAENALAKVVAVLPADAEDAAAASGLLAGPVAAGTKGVIGVLRAALRSEQSVRIRYTDKDGVASERIVWPVVLGIFEAAEVLAAWCEMRAAFRHFRLDRIAAAVPTGRRSPRRRRILMAEWRLAADGN